MKTPKTDFDRSYEYEDGKVYYKNPAKKRITFN